MSQLTPRTSSNTLPKIRKYLLVAENKDQITFMKKKRFYCNKSQIQTNSFVDLLPRTLRSLNKAVTKILVNSEEKPRALNALLNNSLFYLRESLKYSKSLTNFHLKIEKGDLITKAGFFCAKKLIREHPKLLNLQCDFPSAIVATHENIFNLMLKGVAALRKIQVINLYFHHVFRVNISPSVQKGMSKSFLTGSKRFRPRELLAWGGLARILKFQMFSYDSPRMNKQIMVTENDIKALSEAFSYHKHMGNLALDLTESKGLTDKSMHYLFEAFRSLPLLSYLNLIITSTPNLTKEGYLDLAQSLKSMPNLRQFSVRFSIGTGDNAENKAWDYALNTLSPCDNLQGLMISSPDLFDIEIKRNKSLEDQSMKLARSYIRLYKNSTNYAMENLNKILSILNYSPKLILRFQSVTRVTDYGWQLLIKALKNLEGLQELSFRILQCWKFYKSELEGLYEAIISYKGLQELIVNIEDCPEVKEAELANFSEVITQYRKDMPGKTNISFK